MNMRTQSQLKMALAIAAIGMMTSCSHDYSGPDIPGSEVKVTASIQQLVSRVNGTQWESGDAIGIHEESLTNNVNVKYNAAIDGTFSPAGSPIYVLGASTVKFNAYHPYNPAVSAEAPSINFDAASGDNVDYMWATASASRDNAHVDFVFAHMMSKIKIAIAGDASQNGQPMSVTLNGVVTQGSFHTPTGIVTGSGELGSITCDGTVGSSAEFILPPVAEGQTAPEATITITVNGVSYQGAFTPQMIQSTQCNYKVNLANTDEYNNITVSTATITDWTPSDGGTIVVEEKEAENILEVGDFYLSDGKIIDRRVNLSDEQKAMVVGVVYYVGNPQPSVMYPSNYTADQDLLKADHPECVNGLALGYVNPAKGAHFLDVELCGGVGMMNAWMMNNDKNGIYSARYQWIDGEVSGSKANTAGENNFLGYNNTSLWKQFAQANNITATGEDDFIALSQLNEYAAANPLPSSTSGWYIPSLGEMKTLMVSDGNDTPAYMPLEALQASFLKLGDDTFLQKSRYWTSTEGRINSDKAQTMSVTFYQSENWVNKFSPTNNNTTGWFHYSFAF